VVSTSAQLASFSKQFLANFGTDQSLTAQIKPEVERRLSKTFGRFEATQVRRQVVAGTVYHIRVLTTEAKGSDGGEGAEGCLHVRVFQPLPYTGSPPEVQAVKVAEAADSLEVL